jgi:hypothetical protein
MVNLVVWSVSFVGGGELGEVWASTEAEARTKFATVNKSRGGASIADAELRVTSRGNPETVARIESAKRREERKLGVQRFNKIPDGEDADVGTDGNLGGSYRVQS